MKRPTHFAIGLSLLFTHRTLASLDLYKRSRTPPSRLNPHDPSSTFSTRSIDASLPTGWSHFECIQDRGEPYRILPAYTFMSAEMTPSQCVEVCSQKGYHLAGVQGGTECWCDDYYNTSGGEVKKVEVFGNACGKPCPGDEELRCGEAWIMDVYRIDLSKRGDLDWIPDPPPAWVEGPCMMDNQPMRQVKKNECSTPPGVEDASETCRGEQRMRVFPRNEALDSYALGFTRMGSEMTIASSPPPSFSPSQGSETNSTRPGSFSQESSGQDPFSDLGIAVGYNPTDINTGVNVASIADKKVIAHHIVGNTYPYTLDTWISDVKLAKAAGIDAFALNFGQGGLGGWQRDRMVDAFKAADMVGGFGMIFSFDMSVLPCATQGDAGVLRRYIMDYGTRSGHLTITPVEGSNLQRVVVSTFAGEYCSFGKGSVREGWLSVIKDPVVTAHLKMAGREVTFVPAWFARVDSRRQEFGGVIQGDFHWNGGWPAGDNDINWDTDAYRLANNPGLLYMASVSPWFFTHYGTDSYSKNFIYRGDDWLYASRWELLMKHRAKVDLVEIVSWNDYGESHYIGPIEGDQPNSQAWVNGYPHLGFLEMTSYYIQGYKTGTYPTITKDKVYIWSRPHPRNAKVPQDSVGRPNNADWTDDYLWALVMASGPGEFTLTSGGNTQKFHVAAGGNNFKVANSPGPIRGTLARRRAVVVDVNPGDQFSYTLIPLSYNFNVFVASG